MILTVTHKTTYQYEPEASAIALRLRTFPSQYEGQIVEDWSVTVNGETVSPMLTDGMGDEIALWHIHEQIDHVEIIATGTVQTEDNSGLIKGLPTKAPHAVFLRDTDTTRADSDIRDFAAEFSDGTALEQMHALSAAIKETFKYTPGSTAETTTAAEAFAQKSGVCQDFTHIMISTARAKGLPARYVSGYLLSNPDEVEVNETHAWSEVYIDNLGWVGFDPTNGLCPTDRYIRLSCGLDADSAAPIRGSVTGASEVEMAADVQIGTIQRQVQQ